jgi:hypothetical protein
VIRNVEKGRSGTLKQGLLSFTISVTGEEVGYADLKDLNGFYDILLDCIRSNGLERTSSTGSGVKGIDGNTACSTKTTTTDPIESNTQGKGIVENQLPDISQGHLGELAIDTIIQAPVEKVYNLLYHNREFITNAYQKDNKLSSESGSPTYPDKPTLPYSNSKHLLLVLSNSRSRGSMLRSSWLTDSLRYKYQRLVARSEWKENEISTLYHGDGELSLPLSLVSTSCSLVSDRALISLARSLTHRNKVSPNLLVLLPQPSSE